MGAQILFLMKTQFGSFYKKMVFFIRILWVSFFSSMFCLFGFVRRNVFRLKKKSGMKYEFIGEGDKNDGKVIEEEDEPESFLRFRFRTFEEFAQINNVDCVSDQTLRKKSDEPQINLQSDEIRNFIEKCRGVASMIEDGHEHVHFASDEGKEVTECAKIRVVENMFEVPQCSSDDGRSQIDEVENFIDDCRGFGNVDKDGHDHEMSSERDDSLRDDIGPHARGVGENIEEKGKDNNEGVLYLKKDARFVRLESHFLSDDESLVLDSDTDSMVSGSESSFRSSFIDSLSDGLLSEIDFERAFEIDVSKDFCWKEVNVARAELTEENVLENLSRGYGSDDPDNEDEDIVQELKNIEAEIRDENFHVIDSDDDTDMESELVSERNSCQSHSNMSSLNCDEHNLKPDLVDLIDILKAGDECIIEDQDLAENFSSQKQLSSNSENSEVSSSVDIHDPVQHTEDFTDSLDDRNESIGDPASEKKHDAENSSSGEQLSSDSDDQNGLEREWEHQDLVEQLKMEIKKVRAIGLPTILEESESPKIMDDLKPLKIEKFQHEGTLDELHKFYKSYRERMRKLDILNYQKMYAIGFLKLKDPLQSFTRNKISTSALAAIVSVGCWPCKPKSSSEIHEPEMKRFTRELENDLEMIYVSQMCLSWEFLCWEYGKVLELWESDPHGVRRYNEVAEKFQTFQVLLTRFMEDEQYQGPRVQYYVKTRCTRRDLLQVPVIRDDEYKDRRRGRKEVITKDAIKSLQLIEIIEESIRILWQFIRSDKDTNNSFLLKCRRTSNVELQNPADTTLLAEVRLTLQKKNFKLKELTRSESCVLRNFHKHQADDSSDPVLYFFSRVGLKLVSRVLNMSQISSDQLVWCRDKLDKISFVGKRLHVEPSVLLFPCS